MHTMTQIVKKSFCLAALLAAGAASAKTYYVAMNEGYAEPVPDGLMLLVR